MKNKLNNKKIAIVIAILAILIIGIIIGIIASMNKNSNEATEPLVREEDGLPLTLTEENLNEMIDYMNSYDEIVIHYNVFENIYDENNEYLDSNYIKGISSKINLLTLDEWTLDSNKIFLDKEDPDNYEPTEKELADATITFEEAFGFDFKDYNNVYDLSCAIARTQGSVPESFVGSKINVQMYDDLYEEYGKKYYFYENENFDPQIEDYDEILSKQFKIVTNIDNLGKEHLQFIDATVVYTKDGKTIEKNWETIIWLMMDENVINLEE